jgi:hypothetical protein
VKIRDIKTILTAPNRIRLVVVKVETTEVPSRSSKLVRTPPGAVAAFLVASAIEFRVLRLPDGSEPRHRPRAPIFGPV